MIKRENINLIKASHLINRPLNFNEGMDAIAKQITEGIKKHYENNPHTVFDVELDFSDAKTLTDDMRWELQDSFKPYLRELPFMESDLAYLRMGEELFIYCENGKLRMVLPIMDEDGYEWYCNRGELRCCWGEYTITNVFNEDIVKEATKKLSMKRNTKKGLPIGKYRFEWYGKKLIKID